jgi:nitroreductase
MKKIFFLAIVLPFLLTPVFSQQNSSATSAANLILNHYAARNFVEGAIPSSDLDTIIKAGIRAPSAGNRQPWHFTVVQNLDLVKQIVSGSVNGNVLIVVSAQGDGKTNGVQILDCALAVQSIYLAAQALGYGSRIYTGPIDTVNSRFKTQLGLPSGHNAVALVKVGRLQGQVDAVTAASSRKSAQELVTYK